MKNPNKNMRSRSYKQVTEDEVFEARARKQTDSTSTQVTTEDTQATTESAQVTTENAQVTTENMEATSESTHVNQ